MSNTLSPAFIQEWSDDVTHNASQTNTRLMDTVRVYHTDAKTYNFHKMGNTSAVPRPDGSWDDVAASNPSVATQPTVLQNYETGIYIPKFDELKVNVDEHVEYQEEAVASIHRAVDDVIISALGTATATANTYATLTFGAVQAQAYYLDSSDVEEEDRVLIFASQQLQDLLSVQQFSDIFYLGMIDMGGTPIAQGKAVPVLGFSKFVRTNRLSLSGTNRTCYAYSKKGVGLAVGQDVQTTFDWVPQKRSWLIVSDMSMAGAIIDQARVTPLTVQSG